MSAKASVSRVSWISHLRLGLLGQKLWLDISDRYEGGVCYGFHVDYFFQLDNAPYKISPAIFRTATKADRIFDRLDITLSDLSALTLLVLFTIDPTSLPRNDSYILNWAKSACRHVQGHEYDRQQVRFANRDSE